MTKADAEVVLHCAKNFVLVSVLVSQLIPNPHFVEAVHAVFLLCAAPLTVLEGWCDRLNVALHGRYHCKSRLVACHHTP